MQEERLRAADDIFTTIREYLTKEDEAFGALKLLHKSSQENPGYDKARTRFHREIDTLTELQHPNLIPVLDRDPNGDWVVFKYYPKGSLQDNIDCLRGDPRIALKTFTGLVDAVRKLHGKDIVHRDIKPENIFIGTDNALILGDFGLVITTDEDQTRVTSTREKVGTTNWMPTWAIGKPRMSDVNKSFDVFSLGKILWAIVAGDPLLQLHYFDRKEFNLHQRFPDDTRMTWINELLEKCVVQDEVDCLPDANKLYQQLKYLNSRFDVDKARCCKICQTGKYIIEQPKYFSKIIEKICDSCGHVECFRVTEKK